MSGFPRDLPAALARDYDLIVVGGGIYGMTLTLEAARRGLRTLLIARDDFGGAASLSSLRILHGGLRYLQSMDLPRFFESVGQRSWFFETFAPLCRVLPCLMPLYGQGLKRPSMLRVALALNDLLSRRALGSSRVLGIEETVARYPQVPRSGLRGSALWYDGQLLCPQRLHMELLRWAAACGATLLNHTEALALEQEGGHVTGLVTSAGTFQAKVVVNASGSWSREVAARLDQDYPELMEPSLTFNLLLDVPPPSEAAVAVEGERMYFITPFRNECTFVGTVHRVWEGKRQPDEELVQAFIDDLVRVVPGWPVSRDRVVRVTAGVLPCQGPGQADMAHRSTFVRHGIEGLYSICGIKYTTAQGFAAKTMERIFGRRPVSPLGPDFGDRMALADPAVVMALDDRALVCLAEEEAAAGVEDFMERRMDWIVDPGERETFAARLCSLPDFPGTQGGGHGA
jgi:glycerol-3-phosphate dehydrogenase